MKNISWLASIFIRFEILVYIFFLLLQSILYACGIFPFKINSNFFELGVFFIFIGYLAQIDCTHILQQPIEKNPKKDANIRRVMFFLSSFLICFGLSFFWYSILIKILIIILPFLLRFIIYKKYNSITIEIFEKLQQEPIIKENFFIKEKIILTILIYLNIVLNCFLYELSNILYF